MTTAMLPTTTDSATSSAAVLDHKDTSPAPSVVAAPKPATNPFAGKSSRFWLIFVALCTSCFLSAIDLTAVSTAIPDSELNPKPQIAYC